MQPRLMVQEGSVHSCSLCIRRGTRLRDAGVGEGGDGVGKAVNGKGGLILEKSSDMGVMWIKCDLDGSFVAVREDTQSRYFRTMCLDAIDLTNDSGGGMSREGTTAED